MKGGLRGDMAEAAGICLPTARKLPVNIGMMTALLLLFILPLPAPLLAIPAAPILHQVKQSDGTVFSARRWGNENLSGWETADGTTIVFDGSRNAWTYGELDRNGDLVGSDRLVGIDPPPVAQRKRVRPLRQKKIHRRPHGPARFLAAPAVESSGATSPLGLQAAPPTVDAPLPAILVNFTDRTPLYTTADFTTLLFGSGTWSMRDYYREVSYGAFTVAPGPAGVIGWVTATHPHDYYGRNLSSMGDDAWPGDLVREAVETADATVDFAPYDSDGDCVVDVVAIIHQGTGEEASPSDTDIWSHSWSLADAFAWGYGHSGAYTTNDRCLSDNSKFVTIDNYIIQPEQFNGGLSTVGVFAHEYGHALGLPDLYDTDYSSEGVGTWSLMSGGGWAGVSRGGDRPSHFDPWSKYRLGWITPTLLTASFSGKSFAGIESASDYYQIRTGTPITNGGEYFLLENRQRQSFDAGLPGSGLLLWHIDEAVDTNNNEWYPGCTDCTSHYRVALIQADNLFSLEKGLDSGSGGDPFPGTSHRYAIDGTTTPANTLYNGSASGFAMDTISASAPTMTANLVITDTTPPTTTITARPPDVSSSPLATFTFLASEVSTFHCRLDGGSFAPCTSPWNLSGLADGDHSFAVRATDTMGNQETSPPSGTWRVDPTVTPNVRLTISGQPIYYFATLTDTVAAIPAGATSTVLVRGVDFSENVTFSADSAISFTGGYNQQYSARSGTTVLHGSVTVAAGTVTFDNLVLQ